MVLSRLETCSPLLRWTTVPGSSQGVKAHSWSANWTLTRWLQWSSEITARLGFLLLLRGLTSLYNVQVFSDRNFTVHSATSSLPPHIILNSSPNLQNGTRKSQQHSIALMATHPVTNHAKCSLTLVFHRELLCPTCYHCWHYETFLFAQISCTGSIICSETWMDLNNYSFFLIIILVFPHYYYFPHYYDFFTFIIPGTTVNGIISVSSVIPVSSVFSSLKFTLSTSSWNTWAMSSSLLWWSSSCSTA